MLKKNDCPKCMGSRFIRVDKTHSKLCHICNGNGYVYVNKEIPSQLIKDVLGLFNERQERLEIRNEMLNRKLPKRS